MARRGIAFFAIATERRSALGEQAPTAVLAQVIAAIVCGDFEREEEP